MTAEERLKTIASIDRKLLSAAQNGRRLSLTPGEVEVMINLNIHALVSGARNEALQDHNKCREENRKASTSAARIGSTSTGGAMGPRAALTIISSGMTQGADAQSALQRARRMSQPRSKR